MEDFQRLREVVLREIDGKPKHRKKLRKNVFVRKEIPKENVEYPTSYGIILLLLFITIILVLFFLFYL